MFWHRRDRNGATIKLTVVIHHRIRRNTDGYVDVGVVDHRPRIGLDCGLPRLINRHDIERAIHDVGDVGDDHLLAAIGAIGSRRGGCAAVILKVVFTGGDAGHEKVAALVGGGVDDGTGHQTHGGADQRLDATPVGGVGVENAATERRNAIGVGRGNGDGDHGAGLLSAVVDGEGEVVVAHLVSGGGKGEATAGGVKGGIGRQRQRRHGKGQRRLGRVVDRQIQPKEAAQWRLLGCNRAKAKRARIAPLATRDCRQEDVARLGVTIRRQRDGLSSFLWQRRSKRRLRQGK